MKIKMEKLKDIGTWELVELPKERTAIGCRWVFAAKTTPDGQFDTARARVVAQGFTQTPRINYYYYYFLTPFISIEASLIQDNTLDVATERSFMVILSIGLKVWEVPNRTNIPESVGMGVKEKRVQA